MVLLYPQSVVKSVVLDQLINDYRGAGDHDNTVNIANRLAQVDSSKVEAIVSTALANRNKCIKTRDEHTCDAGTRLEDLTPNAAMRGFILDLTVTVVITQWIGSEAL
jgi:hypothetical protein